MQYQILDKDNTVIAWIDDESGNVIVDKNYQVIQGEDLDCISIGGLLKPVIKMLAKFPEKDKE